VKPGDRFGRHEPLMMREFIIDPEGDTSDIDAQRELFRTSGRRTRATVVGARQVGPGTIGETVVTFRVREHTFERSVRVAYAPMPGDEIEVAFSADGSQIALDSDERFLSTPPGQGLVFTTPAELAHQRSPEGQREQMDVLKANAQENVKITMIEQLAVQHRAGNLSDEQFESMKANVLDHGTPGPSEPDTADDRLARLEAAHAAGAISEKHYKQMKQAMERAAGR
jgi:hypothetical protein